MRRLFILLTLLFAFPAAAVEPDEVLDDPALEARARALSKGLRCLVCQNESIDESNAELARELRIVLRDRLTKGDSDSQAIDFIVARYGEYVLLRPTVTGANWLLWAAGPLMLILAGGVGFGYLRGRSKSEEPEVAALTQAEQQRLDDLLSTPSDDNES